MSTKQKKKTDLQSWSQDALNNAVEEILAERIGYFRASELFNVQQTTQERRVKKARDPLFSSFSVSPKDLMPIPKAQRLALETVRRNSKSFLSSHELGSKAAIVTCAASPTMSLASVHPPEMHGSLSHRSRSIGSLGSSFEELHNYFNSSDAVLSIEELRLQLNSCFTCGVSWHEDHVSLDCRECGGYSLVRPCPLCEGRCRAVWKRDLTMSHATGKARWEGECMLRCNTNPSVLFKSIAAEEESRLCSRMEKLGSSS